MLSDTMYNIHTRIQVSTFLLRSSLICLLGRLIAWILVWNCEKNKKEERKKKSEISCKENKDVYVQNYKKKKHSSTKKISYFASDLIFNRFSPLTV